MTTRWLSVTLFSAMLLSAGACKKEEAAPVAKPSEKPNEEVVGPPVFEDVTSTAGIDFTYRNGENLTDAEGKPLLDAAGKPRSHLAILESLGGGAALIDFDGDGLLDVYIPGGGYYADAPDYHTIKGHAGKLFRNLGGFKFEDVTKQAGLDKLAGGKPWFYSHGAAVADYDRDGWPDLLVTGWGGVALFRNVPVDPADPKKGRRFEDVTAKAGLDKGIEWTTSAAFADLDGDGYPDLYICQYVNWSFANHPQCTYDGKTPDVCPPKNFDGLPHKLFHNDGKGGFSDVGKQAGLKSGGPNASKGLGVLIVDVDGDGKPDIYVCNDTVDNFLYINKSKRGELLFDEQGIFSGSARDDRGVANGSMGADAGDPDRVGKPYIWVTNYENELHALYRNECRPGRAFFNHRTAAAGIAAIGQKYVGWGTAFIDVDLDGWEDLFVANGHAIRFPTGKDSNRSQQPVLLINDKGKFHNASPLIGDYFQKKHLSRGVAFGDLNNDGRTDLVVCHTNEPVAMLRGNGGQGRHWIGIGLEGKDHACVVGAKAVFATEKATQTRFVKGGGSYASSGDRRLLFGLGKEQSGKLAITWPDGAVETFNDLTVDRYYRIVQGTGKAINFPRTDN